MRGVKVRGIEAVVIGGSSGAVEALQEILGSLAPDFPVPIAAVVSPSAGDGIDVAHRLRAKCRFQVKEAEDKELLAPSTLYLAPQGYHLLIERAGTFSLSMDDLDKHARPSIDVLFESAAEALESGVVGILLGGANDDGIRGLTRIKQRGGLSYVQSPDGAATRTMREAALRISHPSWIVPLPELAPLLTRLSRPA